MMADAADKTNSLYVDETQVEGFILWTGNEFESRQFYHSTEQSITCILL